jgi:hypothetical protein
MREILIAAALMASACVDREPEPTSVLVDAAPRAARNCGAPGEPSPPPPDSLSIAVSVDPPAVPRWPDVACRGGRAGVLCERKLDAITSIFTDFRFDDGVVRIYYSTPDRCELEYEITRLTWGD